MCQGGRWFFKHERSGCVWFFGLGMGEGRARAIYAGFEEPLLSLATWVEKHILRAATHSPKEKAVFSGRGKGVGGLWGCG